MKERDLHDCMNFMILLFVSQERLFSLRFIYDLTFFLIVIVIIFQNLIFGVIIDTFADLRAEKNRKEEQLKNDCFICGEHYYMSAIIYCRSGNFSITNKHFLISSTEKWSAHLILTTNSS